MNPWLHWLRYWRDLIAALDRHERAKADLIDAAMRNIDMSNEQKRRAEDVTRGLTRAQQGVVDEVARFEGDLSKGTK